MVCNLTKIRGKNIHSFFSFFLFCLILCISKKALHPIFFSDHVTVEMDFSKALNRLGETAIMREDIQDYGSDDIGAAFQKFSVVTKALSNLMKNLVSRGTSN